MDPDPLPPVFFAVTETLKGLPTFVLYVCEGVVSTVVNSEEPSPQSITN